MLRWSRWVNFLCFVSITITPPSMSGMLLAVSWTFAAFSVNVGCSFHPCGSRKTWRPGPCPRCLWPGRSGRPDRGLAAKESVTFWISGLEGQQLTRSQPKLQKTRSQPVAKADRGGPISRSVSFMSRQPKHPYYCPERYSGTCHWSEILLIILYCTFVGDAWPRE